MKNVLLLVTMITILLILGCSRSDSPITSSYYPNEKAGYDNLPIGITDYYPDGSIASGTGTLGVFQLHLDPFALTGEMTNLRKGSLTDVLESVDITNFLKLAPCTDCVRMKSISLDTENHVVVEIGIKHPFEAGDPLKPITGRNRADLHVFNVEGIVISDSHGASFTAIGETISALKLVNAAGYTGYLDAALDEIFPTDASVHPYALHFNDYSAGNFNAGNPMGFQSVTDPPPSGNLVMPMGCDYDYQNYVFDLTGSQNLIFAVGCTYGVSAASKNERFTPEYRIPQHNKKAASEIRVEIISNDLISGNSSSMAEIEIHVVDISHGVAVGEALNEMLSDSSVNDIYVEVPGVMTSTIIIDGSSSVSGSGHSPSDPLVYEATITNSASGTEGNYTGLVKVIDTYLPGQNGSPLLSGMDGIKRVDPLANPLTGLFEISEFATYQTFSIEVSQACGPITGSITDPVCPVQHVWDGQSIIFSASASSANGGGNVVLYEWCMNYDGNPSNFTVDAVGQSVTLGPFINANCDVNPGSFKNFELRDDSTAKDLAVTPQGDLLILYDDAKVYKYAESEYFQHFTQPVTYTVAVRGTDECVPPNVTIFAECEVVVDVCADYLFTAIVVQRGYYSPPPAPILANAFIDVSDSGNIFASSADGSCITSPVIIEQYPSQSFNSAGVPQGTGPAHCTGGPITEVFCYKAGSSGWALDHVNMAPGNSGAQSNMYRQTDGSWGWIQQYGQNCHGSGYDKIMNINVKGAEAVSTNQFWALEDTPDYYCSRFIQSDFFYYYYDNSYFGTGSKTDSDTCWNEAKDLTVDSRGYLYVLDKLTTSKGRVKGFTGSSTGGSSLGHFDIPDNFSSNPLRIEGSTVTGAYGNLIFILHGDSTDGYYLSVFLPSEIPW